MKNRVPYFLILQSMLCTPLFMLAMHQDSPTHTPISSEKDWERKEEREECTVTLRAHTQEKAFFPLDPHASDERVSHDNGFSANSSYYQPAQRFGNGEEDVAALYARIEQEEEQRRQQEKEYKKHQQIIQKWLSDNFPEPTQDHHSDNEPDLTAQAESVLHHDQHQQNPIAQLCTQIGQSQEKFIALLPAYAPYENAYLPIPVCFTVFGGSESDQMPACAPVQFMNTDQLLDQNTIQVLHEACTTCFTETTNILNIFFKEWQQILNTQHHDLPLKLNQCITAWQQHPDQFNHAQYNTFMQLLYTQLKIINNYQAQCYALYQSIHQQPINNYLASLHRVYISQHTSPLNLTISQKLETQKNHIQQHYFATLQQIAYITGNYYNALMHLGVCAQQIAVQHPQSCTSLSQEAGAIPDTAEENVQELHQSLTEIMDNNNPVLVSSMIDVLNNVLSIRQPMNNRPPQEEELPPYADTHMGNVTPITDAHITELFTHCLETLNTTIQNGSAHLTLSVTDLLMQAEEYKKNTNILTQEQYVDTIHNFLYASRSLLQTQKNIQRQQNSFQAKQLVKLSSYTQNPQNPFSVYREVTNRLNSHLGAVIRKLNERLVEIQYIAHTKGFDLIHYLDDLDAQDQEDEKVHSQDNLNSTPSYSSRDTDPLNVQASGHSDTNSITHNGTKINSDDPATIESPAIESVFNSTESQTPDSGSSNSAAIHQPTPTTDESPRLTTPCNPEITDIELGDFPPELVPLGWTPPTQTQQSSGTTPVNTPITRSQSIAIPTHNTTPLAPQTSTQNSSKSSLKSAPMHKKPIVNSTSCINTITRNSTASSAPSKQSPQLPQSSLTNAQTAGIIAAGVGIAGGVYTVYTYFSKELQATFDRIKRALFKAKSIPQTNALKQKAINSTPVSKN